MPLGRSRQPDRRARLLDAAEDLFVRWGFDKTSVDDMARESGISKGAVYLEFAGKDDVLRAVLYRELARFTADWLDRFEADPGEWSFARVFQHHLAAVQARPLMRALITRDRRVLGGFLRQETELSEVLTANRERFFAGLQAAGVMRDDISPGVLAYLLSAIGYGLMLADDVVPAARQVPFGEALEALGRLLDRGLDSGDPAARARVRALLGQVFAELRSSFAEGKP